MDSLILRLLKETAWVQGHSWRRIDLAMLQNFMQKSFNLRTLVRFGFFVLAFSICSPTVYKVFHRTLAPDLCMHTPNMAHWLHVIQCNHHTFRRLHFKFVYSSSYVAFHALRNKFQHVYILSSTIRTVSISLLQRELVACSVHKLKHTPSNLPGLRALYLER